MRSQIPLLAALLAALPAAADEGGTVAGAVSAEGAAARPTIVYIEQAAPAQAPLSRPRIVQRNTTFQPASLVVMQGQTVDFPNEDKFYHNVFSLSPGNDFDLGIYRGGASKGALLAHPG
jgi:plastocyanin